MNAWPPLTQLKPGDPFPPLSQAWPAHSPAPGLVAVGGALDVPSLLAAYAATIFPWFSEGEPILWWSPDPRMVLPPGELKISRSLAKTLRNASYEVRLDTAFAEVIEACAQRPRPGQAGTWIGAEMRDAYKELHRRGHAHSVETWIDGRLAGGLYGVAIGRAFFGESMFSLARDASKIALAHLCAYIVRRGFGIIDCQMETSHLASLGARPIPRRDFIARLDALCAQGDAPGHWAEDGIAGHYRRPA